MSNRNYHLTTLKQTKKNVAEFNATFRCDVFEINSDGSRGCHYGGVTPLEALAFIATRCYSMNLVITKAGLRLNEVYPDLDVIKASGFSQRDTDFFRRIKQFAINLPSLTR